MPNPLDREAELLLLGAALYLAQKVEFALYGISSHLSHFPEAQADRRLKILTGEKFLRGNLKDMRITLGQLTDVFGKKLLLASSDLDKFVEDRNFIVHNYFRHFHTKFGDRNKMESAEVFLQSFLERATSLIAVLEGLIVIIRETAARKENRTNEITLSETDIKNKNAYLDYVEKNYNL